MEDFPLEITKRAVAKACVALDYKYASSSVLEIMGDVLHRYIKSVGEFTREQAEGAGRSQPGIHDALAALEQSRPHSTTWKELRDFAFEDVKNPTLESTKKWCEQFPFAIPNFPVRQKTQIKMNIQTDTEGRPKYVPSHLPPFPPEHTYKRTVKKRSLDQKSIASEPHQRTKRIIATNSIQQSLSLIEAIQSHGKPSVNNIEISPQYTAGSDMSQGPPLEVEQYPVDSSRGSVSIPLESRRTLSKEQRVLLGIPPDSSTA